MNKQTEALKMAIDLIDAMEYHEDLIGYDAYRIDTDLNLDLDKIRQACKEALEQPAQEPVAWVSEVTLGNIEWIRKQDTDNCLEIFCCCDKWDDNNIPLYTHPAPSCNGMQGLTISI